MVKKTGSASTRSTKSARKTRSTARSSKSPKLKKELNAGSNKSSFVPDVITAQRKQRVDLAIDRQIKMRNGGFRFDQPAGNGLTHIVVRDEFVGAFLEELQHRVVGHRLGGRSRRGTRGLRRRRCLRAAAGNCRVHVRLDDASMRTGALHARNVDAGIERDTARQR